MNYEAHVYFDPAGSECMLFCLCFWIRSDKRGGAGLYGRVRILLNWYPESH